MLHTRQTSQIQSTPGIMLGGRKQRSERPLRKVSPLCPAFPKYATSNLIQDKKLGPCVNAILSGVGDAAARTPERSAEHSANL
jgi:hypothetical protein